MFMGTYSRDHADGTTASAGHLPPAGRGGCLATEEEEKVGVEEGDGPQDGHAPELWRAHHAERGTIHGRKLAYGRFFFFDILRTSEIDLYGPQNSFFLHF
jgi:hypothetical protein